MCFTCDDTQQQVSNNVAQQCHNIKTVSQTIRNVTPSTHTMKCTTHKSPTTTLSWASEWIEFKKENITNWFIILVLIIKCRLMIRMKKKKRFN